MLRKLLSLLLQWLDRYVTMDDKMAEPTALDIGLDILPVGTAALNAATAIVKGITTLQEEANSPDELKAAAAKKKLADMDALALAQRTDDLETERKFSENAQP